MFMSIRVTGEGARDLSYLLQKHPENIVERGTTIVKTQCFFPRYDETNVEFVVTGSMNPIDLVRKERMGQLDEYVNDRPYVASSYFVTAFREALSSALNGKCAEKPDLVSKVWDLSITVPAIRNPPPRNEKDGTCSSEFLAALFTPLGWSVTTTRGHADDRFPEWGESHIVSVTLSGLFPLMTALRHLFILLPVVDKTKHHAVDLQEAQKLISKGEGWLETHPMKAAIIGRYLGYKKKLVDAATAGLEAPETEEEIEEEEAEPAPAATEEARFPSLHIQRHEAVIARMVFDGVFDGVTGSLCDLGCGEGRFIQHLYDQAAERKWIPAKIVGVDPSRFALRWARRKLKSDSVKLLQGSALFRDARLHGFDAMVAIEMIEHIDPERLPDFEQAVFGDYKPKRFYLTTPNREFNAVFGIPDGELRHRDHRFEWTRDEFKDWCEHIFDQYNYTTEFFGVGQEDETYGQPSQGVVFTR